MMRQSTITPNPYDFLKRVFDLVCSCVALIVTAPVMAVIALVVLVSDGRPVLFVQVRPGLGGRPFRLVKFRTLRTSDGEAATDVSAGVTWVGQILKSTSLDELPSLWNVIRGDLSLVGPRPLLMEYLPLYLPEHLKRHDVRPGMTGLSQVSGRNLVSWRQRFDMDIAYVRDRGFALDLKILLKTVLVVLGRRGVSRADGTMMPTPDANYHQQTDS